MAVPDIASWAAMPQLAWLLLAAAVLVALLRGARVAHADVHKRGTEVLHGRRARRVIRRRRGRAPQALVLAGVPIAAHEETQHFKLLGTTGTGKSTAIASLLRQALARGDRAVVTDPDGGYAARFFAPRRGDLLLNPFEPHSVRWDPFAELRERWDVEQLARGLVPSSEDAAAHEWRGYARTFISAVLRGCHERGMRDVAELWRLLAIASADELRVLVAGSAAQPFCEAENARMFSSIRSVAVSAAAALEHLARQRGRGFGVRDWVRAGGGALYLPYRAGQIAALRAILATWVRLAIFEAMETPPRPLWFVVDELDALGAIDGLKDALARLRKFGGRCVLGFQSVSQVTATYGSDSQTLIENCGTTLILRCSASEQGGTSQFAARLIGEREVIRRQTARAREGARLGSVRRSRTISEQHVLEPAVLAAQIEQLPDLCGYLKTAGAREWLRVRVPCEP
jgi:type IV secretory pathway TraG/TraD family ATPase VirD4